MDSLYVYASAVTALTIIAPDSVHEQTHENAGLESYKSRVCWLGFGGQGRRGCLTRSSSPPSSGSRNGAIALGSLTVIPVQSAFPGLHDMLRLWWTLPSLTFMPPWIADRDRVDASPATHFTRPSREHIGIAGLPRDLSAVRSDP